LERLAVVYEDETDLGGVHEFCPGDGDDKCDPALPRMPTSSNKSPNVSKVVLSTFPWHLLGIENVRG
jgi:hypothetical protein